MQISKVLMAGLLLIGAGVLSSKAAVADTASVGKVTKIQGEVSASGRALEVASPVYDGELLISEAGARLEVVFIDGSVLALGGPAKMFIDEMTYNTSGAGEARARQAIEALEGAFRFLTGAVGRENPSGVRIATPVATIGIRGTDFWGGPIDRGVGVDEFGVLIFDGAVTVTNDQGTVTLDGFTEGTFIPTDSSVAPTDPGTWQQNTIDAAVATITFDD